MSQLKCFSCTHPLRRRSKPFFSAHFLFSNQEVVNVRPAIKLHTFVSHCCMLHLWPCHVTISHAFLEFIIQQHLSGRPHLLYVDITSPVWGTLQLAGFYCPLLFERVTSQLTILGPQPWKALVKMCPLMCKRSVYVLQKYTPCRSHLFKSTLQIFDI